jgi:hypothetical protein
LAEIRFESSNHEGYPVSVAVFARLVRRNWRADDDSLSERYDRLVGAGGLRVHNESIPFYLLASLIFSLSY